ncbi:6-hydroxymethylpterin diphosphokinase MptE-like protein [Neptunicoccus cionae]|uniref:6-hydroxymethylpterin diphosphokinase MptE-like domain-containing protein n=1 Tax=Neptunicoccus cionae TaxID=2035344 RepID=A0A916VT36_9RHOB|nr:6-hydroxymethylpterin diphosphokinase MptE-like protein [Amylibacter cionae]GGA29383.1 hypothetical protein GCM10011498_33190 [Amylibacter cionae]
MNLSLRQPLTYEDPLDRLAPEGLEQIYQDTLDLLPSKAPIYLPTDKIPLPDKIRGLRHVAQIYGHDLDALYRPALRRLREKYQGTKRCFLIGNGPSLNDTDLSLLKDEVTFAVNGFFLKLPDLDWTPTFYCVEDHLVAEDRAEWINDLKGPVKLFPAYLGYQFDAAEDTIFYNHRPRVSYPHGFDFSTQADKITYTGCTVTFSLMQLAAYLGFEEIYLIGVDASYDIPKDVNTGTDYGVGVLDMDSDDPNHFNPDYFGKGFRWHDPQVDKMVEAYKEAKKTLKGSGQTIYNATVGGKLEVFARRDYHSLFAKSAPEKPAKTTPARLLVIDYIPAGGQSATGQIKENLLRDFPDANLLQIASPKPDTLSLVRRTGSQGFAETPCNAQTAQQAIADFAPDVILYRPLPDRPCLHEFTLSLIENCDTPLVTWVMDDWPARLKRKDAHRFARFDHDLRGLFDRAALNLSICPKMSRAFTRRYGAPFQSFANGIDAAAFPPRSPHKAGPLLLRYSGNLAADMGLDSLLRVARAIEDLATEGMEIHLEINTRPYWHQQSGAAFKGLTATTLSSIDRDFPSYARWLQDADVALITYNFDAESLAYTRYSMGNKLPECLAAGGALLVHGPKSVATVKQVADHGLGDVVNTQRPAALKAALRKLADPQYRQKRAEHARDFALCHYDLDRIAQEFTTQISRLRRPSPANVIPRPQPPARPQTTDPAPADYLHLREQQVLRLQARLEALAQERKLQRSINYSLRQKIAGQQDRISELETQTRLCATEVATRDQALSALYSSRSWRLTRPLRALRRYFTP